MDNWLKKKRYRPNKKGIDYQHSDENDEKEHIKRKYDYPLEKHSISNQSSKKTTKNIVNNTSITNNTEKINNNNNNVKYVSKLITKEKELVEGNKELEVLKKTLENEKINKIDNKVGFNNIKHYYNRYLEAFKDKSIIEEVWIKDKKCLDIGCNDGTLTFIYAIVYQAESIEAIDIDRSIINKAISNRKFIIDTNFTPEKSEKNCLVMVDKDKGLGINKSNNIIENSVSSINTKNTEITNTKSHCNESDHTNHTDKTNHIEYTKNTNLSKTEVNNETQNVIADRIINEENVDNSENLNKLEEVKQQDKEKVQEQLVVDKHENSDNITTFTKINTTNTSNTTDNNKINTDINTEKIINITDKVVNNINNTESFKLNLKKNFEVKSLLQKISKMPKSFLMNKHYKNTINLKNKSNNINKEDNQNNNKDNSNNINKDNPNKINKDINKYIKNNQYNKHYKHNQNSIDIQDLEKKEKLINIKNPKNKNFPENTIFHTENILLRITNKDITETYDTIFCLSVTKWIHLNYGDIGLEVLFYLIYKLLKKEGILILEPQEWRSYQKHLNKKVEKGNNEKVIKRHLKFNPIYFNKYLIDTYGYKLIKEGLPLSNSKTMIQRKIYIFQK